MTLTFERREGSTGGTINREYQNLNNNKLPGHLKEKKELSSCYVNFITTDIKWVLKIQTSPSYKSNRCRVFVFR